MIATYRPATAFGLVTIYAVLSEANGVVAGNLLQHIDIAAFTFLSFVAVVTINFGSGLFLSDGRGATGGHPAPTLWSRPMIALNLTTAISWILMYVAYANMEPAAATALMCAVGPLASLRHDQFGGPDGQAMRQITVFGFTLGCAVLLYGSLAGQSAVPSFDAARTALGCAAAIGCGYFMNSMAVHIKRLSDRQLTPRQITMHRFYLLLALTGTVAWFDGSLITTATRFGVTIGLLALCGIVFPLSLVVRGIAIGSPFLTMIAMASAPVDCVLLQLFDNRLTTSPISIAGIVIVFAISLLSACAVLRPASIRAALAWTRARVAIYRQPLGSN